MWPDVHVGSISLVETWFDHVLQAPEGRLFIIAPFIDIELLDACGALHSFWQAINHKQSRLRLWTATWDLAIAVSSALSVWPWQELMVYYGGPLHAKAYLHMPARRSPSALIGSMNFTRSGLRGCGELGVLLTPGTNTALNRLLFNLWQELETEAVGHPACRPLATRGGLK